MPCLLAPTIRLSNFLRPTDDREHKGGGALMPAAGTARTVGAAHAAAHTAHAAHTGGQSLQPEGPPVGSPTAVYIG